jgi:branched-subunit amino acid aminotransferase/4-amino-4-deoxychorismate lyase
VSDETYLTWESRTGALFETPRPSTAPLVIDSFLLDEGRVRALDRHLGRFTASCSEVGGADPDMVRPFLREVISALPRTGRWFPRVEQHSEAPERLACWIRPAPPRSDTAKLWSDGHVVRRRAPRVKGPDLTVLDGLRAKARAAGCDDALIVDDDGSVLEGAAHSVLWWRDDVLVLPPNDRPVLPGITKSLLAELVVDHGGAIRYESVRPEALPGRETWLVNALHGIRTVSCYEPGVIVAQQAPRAERWQNLLERLGSPIELTTLP